MDFQPGFYLLILLPFPSETHNPPADVKYFGVGNSALFLDQRHRFLRIISLRNQDSRTHGHAAMPSTRTVRVNFASGMDGL